MSETVSIPNITGRACASCGTPLIPGYARDGGNWPPSRQKRKALRCTNCKTGEDVQWRTDNPKQNRAVRKAYDEATRPARTRYIVQHIHVTAVRGPASAHSCARDCGNQAEQWSWIHETDREDVNNYNPLCRNCHVLYDNYLEEDGDTGEPKLADNPELTTVNGTTDSE